MKSPDIPWDLTPIEQFSEISLGKERLEQLNLIGIYLACDLPHYTVEELLSCDLIGTGIVQGFRNGLRSNRCDFAPSPMRKSGNWHKAPKAEREAVFAALVKRAACQVWCYRKAPEWSPHHGEESPLRLWADKCRRDSTGETAIPPGVDSFKVSVKGSKNG